MFAATSLPRRRRSAASEDRNTSSGNVGTAPQSSTLDLSTHSSNGVILAAAERKSVWRNSWGEACSEFQFDDVDLGAGVGPTPMDIQLTSFSHSS
jgi:hypothetical protein